MATKTKPKVPETETDSRGRLWDVFWATDTEGQKVIGLALPKARDGRQPMTAELLHDGTIRMRELV